jgi:hypothetical protein
VLGPWVNGRWTNLFTGAVAAVLVLLSVILTASVLWPDISSQTIINVLVGGGIIGGIVVIAAHTVKLRRDAETGADLKDDVKPTKLYMHTWRMPPLDQLKPMVLSRANRLWMAVLRGYLVVAVIMVVYKVTQVALLGH